MGVTSAVFLVVLTVLFPPLGVFTVAGWGMDLFINVCLTILGYIPGHLHAFYIEYVYYDRREQAFEGRVATRQAPGIYSRAVQNGGEGYGTIVPTTE